MKKVILTLLAIAAINISNAQIKVLNQSVDSAKIIASELAKFCKTKFTKCDTLKNDKGTTYLLKDSTDFVKVKIVTEVKKTMEGLKVITGEELVTNFNFTIPTNLIFPFVNDVLTSNAKAQNNYQSGSRYYLSTKNYRIVISEGNLLSTATLVKD